MNEKDERAPGATDASELPTDDQVKEEKVMTNSRWQGDNSVPRYDKKQMQDVDRILQATPGFARGARLPGTHK